MTSSVQMTLPVSTAACATVGKTRIAVTTVAAIITITFIVSLLFNEAARALQLGN